MKIKIVVLGYIFNETIVWPDGRTEGPFLGATVSYGAVALGRLGASAGIVTNVGPGTPEAILKPIYDCGINTTGVNIVKGAHETRNTLNYYEDGTKQLEYQTRAPLIQFSDIPESYLSADLYHLCLVDYEIPISTIKKLKKINPGAVISADLGGLGGAHSTQESREKHIRRDSGRVQDQYYSFIDFGKASMEDAEIAFGGEFASEKKAAEAYISKGVKNIIVTLGEKGSYILSRTGIEARIPMIPPRVNDIDTTGAGDTYMTAFMFEYMRSQDLVTAGMFASAAASIFIEQGGGVRVNRTPTYSMTRKRLDDYYQMLQ